MTKGRWKELERQWKVAYSKGVPEDEPGIILPGMSITDVVELIQLRKVYGYAYPATPK